MAKGKRRTVFLVLAVMLILAGGCAADRTGEPEVEISHPSLSDVPGQVRDMVKDNLDKGGELVKRSDDTTYVFVGWGLKPTGGYSVEIRDLARGIAGDYVVISELKAPEEGEKVNEAITFPYDLIAVTGLGAEAKISFAYLAPYTIASDPPPVAEEAAKGKNVILAQPLPGATVTSPFMVRGKARVFEGTLKVMLEDGHNVLFEEWVQASEGGPGWGDFEVKVSYERPTSPNGVLLIVTESAKDGSPVTELEVPLSFGDWDR